jgi:hypothetical protein
VITLLQDAKMVTDLDAGEKVLTNVGKLLPVPNTMVDTEDPRMTDGREILDGTVTDLSVAATAAIEQSKLSLDGNIPTSWLGSDEKTAARGDLVERVASKGAIGGYAALGVSAKLSAGNLPTTGPQLGTVTRVGLSMPGHF